MTAVSWWRSVPNPPCPSWCERQHDPGEFAVGAVILHRGPVVPAEGTTVATRHVSLVAGDEDKPNTFRTLYDEHQVVVLDADLVVADGSPMPLARAVVLAREILRLADEHPELDVR